MNNSPFTIESPVSPPKVIQTQPARKKKLEDLEEKLNRLTGLASLSAANALLITFEQDFCKGSKRYKIMDSERDSLIFEAGEDNSLCSCSCTTKLRNVVIWDLEHQPVARVCYKGISQCFGSGMVIAVYSPPDLLVGTAEEVATCGFSTFSLKDFEAEDLFTVQHSRGLCESAFFKIFSKADGTEAAKITSKDAKLIRIKFLHKMNITSKVNLLGFCIGIVHKAYRQDPT